MFEMISGGVSRPYELYCLFIVVVAVRRNRFILIAVIDCRISCRGDMQYMGNTARS